MFTDRPHSRGASMKARTQIASELRLSKKSIIGQARPAAGNAGIKKRHVQPLRVLWGTSYHHRRHYRMGLLVRQCLSYRRDCFIDPLRAGGIAEGGVWTVVGRSWTPREKRRNPRRYCTLDTLDGLDGFSSLKATLALTAPPPAQPPRDRAKPCSQRLLTTSRSLLDIFRHDRSAAAKWRRYEPNAYLCTLCSSIHYSPLFLKRGSTVQRVQRVQT
jgi:hypothetical protein